MLAFRQNHKLFRRAAHFRNKWQSIDFVLWGLPIFLVLLSGFLIASTQRQADYAEWYQHWLTGLIGLGIALVIAQFPVERLRPFLIPLYICTVLTLVAVKFLGISALGFSSESDIIWRTVSHKSFSSLNRYYLITIYKLLMIPTTD